MFHPAVLRYVSGWKSPTNLDSNLLSFARASAALSIDDVGNYSLSPPDTPRVNGRGHLIEGETSNLVANPVWTWTGTPVFHAGLPPRFQPIISDAGVVTGFTKLDGGTLLSAGIPVSVVVVGSGGSGGIFTLNFVGDALDSITPIQGGAGWPPDAGCVIVCGSQPVGWKFSVSQGAVGGISIAGTSVINGLKTLEAWFVGINNGRNLFLQPTLSSTAVTEGDVISQSIRVKKIGGSLTYVDLVGITFTEGVPVRKARNTYRYDLLRDHPDDFVLIETVGRVMGAGVQTIASPRFITSGVTLASSVFAIKLAIGPMTLSRSPVTTSPIALASNITLGPELLTGAPGLGNGWSDLSGGVYSRTANGGTTSFLTWGSLTLSLGQRYSLGYNIQSISDSSAAYSYLTGGTTQTSTPKSDPGAYTDSFIAQTGNNGARFGGSLSTVLTVDSISLKAVSGSDGLTRAADVSTLGTAAFAKLFTGPNWAVAIDIWLDTSNSAIPRVLWQMHDGTDDNRITVRTVAGIDSIVAEVAVAGVVTATTTMSRAILPGRWSRALLTASAGSLDLTVDGGATNGVTTTLPTVTQARRGNNVAGTMPLNGRVYRTKVLNFRPTTAERTRWSDPAVSLGSPVLGPQAVDYTFVVPTVPDIHFSSSNTAAAEGNAALGWPVTNKAACIIPAVLSEGDIVVRGLPEEFALATPGHYAIRDAGILLAIAVGNHDNRDAGYYDRNTEDFDAAFPPSEFASMPGFGGTMAGQMKNSWYWFDQPLPNGTTRKFIIVSLDLFPDDAMCAWALALFLANPDREGILITHSDLDPDGTLTLNNDPNGYNSRPFPGNDALGVWNKLGKLAPNLKFIVSGHQYIVPAVPTSYLMMVGDAGNKVHHWFCNYQNINGGNGTLGLLRFHSTSSKVDLLAFSALTNSVYPDSVRTLDW